MPEIDTGTGIELVVTDLDGTLWETHDAIPARTLDAVAALERRGVPLLVATGRRRQSTQEPLASFGLAPPAVLLNGGLGIRLATGERFHRGGFSAAHAAAVLAEFQRVGLHPCVYVDHDEFPVRLHQNPSTHPGHVASFGETGKVQDLDDAVAEEVVLAFSVLGIDAALADSVSAQLHDVAVPHSALDRQYGGHGMTVAPVDCSKWEGIEAFCRLEGIDPARTLVIGDGPNDLEMLAQAAIAVVPSDGHADALALADHVVGRAADGGWAELLELF